MALKLNVNPKNDEVYLLSVGLPFDPKNVHLDETGSTRITLEISDQFQKLSLSLAKSQLLAAIHMYEERYTHAQITKIKRKAESFIRKDLRELQFDKGIGSEYPVVVITFYLKDAFDHVRDLSGISELEFIAFESQVIRDKVIEDANKWTGSVNEQIQKQNPPSFVIDRELTVATSVFDEESGCVYFQSESLLNLYRDIQEVNKYVSTQDQAVIRSIRKTSDNELSSSLKIEEELERRSEGYIWPNPIGLIEPEMSEGQASGLVNVKVISKNTKTLEGSKVSLSKPVFVVEEKVIQDVPCQFFGFSLRADTIDVEISSSHSKYDVLMRKIDKKLGFQLVDDLEPFWDARVTYNDLPQYFRGQCTVNFEFDYSIEQYVISDINFLRLEMGCVANQQRSLMS